MNPEVSVVIPCYNEVGYIKDCVLSLLSNGFPAVQLEILVIDGGSTDGTLNILKQLVSEFQQIKILNNPMRITPRSLNIGIEASQGQFILISSAHAAFDKGYVETLMNEMIKLPDAIAVGGTMETKVKHSTPTAESIRTALSHPVGVGNAKFRTGVASIEPVDTVPFGLYRASLLKSVGGYNEQLIRNHDMELSKRLLKNGGKIYLTPNAKCTYFARESFLAMAKNNFNNGKWNLKTVWITNAFTSLSLRHFIPLLFLGSWLIPLLLALGTFKFWFVYVSIGILTSYLSILILVSIKAYNKKNSVPLLMLAFSLLHFAYGLGSLLGLLSLPFTSRSK